MPRHTQHTPGPWIDSSRASDAIISRDQDAVKEWLGDGEGYVQDALNYYGGAVVCESVQAKDKPLIKAAPALYAWAKLWLEAIQNSGALRATLAELPENAGPHMVYMLTKAIDMVEEATND